MRKLAIGTATAFVLSTGLALAQGSGTSTDPGGAKMKGPGAPAAERGTIGQGAAAPAAAPKVQKKKTDKTMKKGLPDEE